MKNCLKFLRHWALLWLLTSCSIQPIQPALHDFGLKNAQNARSAHITVNAPTWLWDNRIRYRLLYQSSTQVRFYGLDLWIASPPELFEQFLTNNLKAIHYSLTIQLLEFEQQFDNPKHAKAVLNFSVDVYNQDLSYPIASKNFHLSQATPTPDAAGAITAFTDLTQQAAVQLLNWLGQLADRSSAPNR